MISINKIVRNVKENCNANIYFERDEDGDCGWYIVEAKAIGINPQQPEPEIIESIVHEVAHHVDISENHHEERSDIDGEVIAHCVEGIICHNEPVQGIIYEYEQEIREAYCFNGVVSIDEDDIQEVADRVKIICNIWG